MKINSIIDLVKDLDTSRQTKNLNKLLIRILLHLQVEFSNFNTHASLKTRYKLDGESYKITDNNIHQTPVTVDLQASFQCKIIGIYVKYSPCQILDAAYGPKFSALSAGIVLF